MKKSVKIWIFAILLIIALVVLSAGILFLYQGRVMPVIGKVVTIPLVELGNRELINNMQKSMSELRSVEFLLLGEANFKTQEVPVNLSFKTRIDKSSDSQKFPAQIHIQNKITVRNIVFIVNLKGVYNGKDLYFQISEVPSVPFLDLRAVEDKWYKYSFRDLVQFDNFIQSLVFISSDNLFQNVERLPDETINGRLSYHLSSVIRPAKLKNIPSQFGFLSSWVSDSLSGQPVEMWIEKETGYLQELKFNFMDGSKDPIKSLIIDISHFNEPLEPVEINNTLEFTQFSRDLFGSTNFLDLPLFGYLIGLDTENLTSDSDKDGLYRVWEDLFKTDPNNPDTDGDGYSDGTEVANGYNPAGSGKLFK